MTYSNSDSENSIHSHLYSNIEINRYLTGGGSHNKEQARMGPMETDSTPIGSEEASRWKQQPVDESDP
ncbi:uncharacterized protein N7529_009808 [Penicillium soppii]|uniref:uncharacterized protein n=1 Tax=Penicillium soppii TaxID=69789 RepID=UPI002549B93F|nr:uncharacterized protein N7529_009808 [Penicillium soppii]KAJ5855864.1 hypothetical protein N7529_009808 [Penicillium soppii]